MARFGVAFTFTFFLLFTGYIFLHFDSLSLVSAPIQHSSVTNNRLVSDEPQDTHHELAINPREPESRHEVVVPEVKPIPKVASNVDPTAPFVSSTDAKKASSVDFPNETSKDSDISKDIFSTFVNKSETENTFSHTPAIPTQSWISANVDKVLALLGSPRPMRTKWLAVEYLTQIKTYFSNRADIVYTGIPKSGCTNWKYTILRLEKLFWEDAPSPKVHYIINSISIANILRRYPYLDMSDRFTFTVIRNPWTRIVSGYNDKFAPERFQRWQGGRVALAILQQYRDPTLTHRDVLRLGLRPTFLEFLRHLAEEELEEINVHFQPQYHMLSLHQVKFDYIGALEHAEVQSAEILRHFAGEQELLEAVPGPYDGSSDPRLERSTILARRWFPQVPPDLIESLYRKFQPDFTLFNYSNFTHPLFPFPLVGEGNV